MSSDACMTDFKARLTAFITTYTGDSIRRFEENCGLTNSTISSIKVKGPSVEVLMKISDRYPELDLNWLVTGRGDMILSGKADDDAKPAVTIKNIQTVNIGNWGDLCEELKKTLTLVIK